MSNDRWGVARAAALAGALAVGATGEAPADEGVVDPTMPRPLARWEWRNLACIATSAELLQWIRDDSIRWNATAAAEELLGRLDDPIERARIVDLLEEHLVAEGPAPVPADEQAHRLAIGLLQAADEIAQRCEASGPRRPSPHLVAASVRIAGEFSGYQEIVWLPGSATARGSILFLRRHGDLAGSDLASAFRVEHPRRRASHTYAYLLAHAGGIVPIEEIAPVLIAGLERNLRPYDALMSLDALGAIGPAAGGAAREALRTSRDPQQRQALELLLAAWDWPAESGLRAEAAERLGRENALTWKVGDPLADWCFRRHALRWEEEATMEPIAARRRVALEVPSK